MLSKLFLKIAGADETLLDEIPTKDDKVWLTQLGAVLTLSYLFMTIIIYYSLQYMADELGQQASKIWILIVSFLISSMILALDRSFILSDWYGEAQISYSHTHWKKTIVIAKRISQALVRIAISLMIVYGTSLFLVLSFYGNAIEKHMRKNFYNANAAYRAKLSEYMQAYDNRTRQLQLKLEALTGQVATLGENTIVAMRYSPELTSLQQALTTKQNELKSLNREISTLQNNSTFTRLSTLTSKKNCLEAKMQIERDTSAPTTFDVCGEGYTSSGVAGEGKRYRTLQSQANALERLISPLEKQAKQIKAKIDGKKSKRNLLIQEIETLKKEIAKKQKEATRSYQKEKSQKRKLLLESVDTLRKQITQREHLRNKEKEHFIQKLKANGLYVPYEDGPLLRFMALEEMLSDPKKGKTLLFFVFLLKGMLVLIEMIPIAMKLFFGKPTGYALALSHRRENFKSRLLDGSVKINKTSNASNEHMA